jgi:hypothetical protein
MLAQQMPFAAVARTIGESWHRVHAICRRYVDLALAGADLSALSSVTIDETSYRRGHIYLTLVADADARKVVFVSKGRGAETSPASSSICAPTTAHQTTSPGPVSTCRRPSSKGVTSSPASRADDVGSNHSAAPTWPLAARLGAGLRSEHRPVHRAGHHRVFRRLALPADVGRGQPSVFRLCRRVLQSNAFPSAILIDELDAGLLKRPSNCKVVRRR